MYLRRAMALAVRGRGRVEPNPMVGCVIVKQGRVIGQGYHQQFGGPHAEPNALAACSESPDGATAYVTLEPCCHEGKKTPPCAPAMIRARLARVVIGCMDPNPRVNGRGAAMLRDAGILVDAPSLEAPCEQLIAPFITRVLSARPYVTLKWAQSADGKVAGPRGARMQISNAVSRQLVHELRSRCNGIMVGINTVLIDDPLLTAREATTPRHPARFVLDRDLRMPPGAAMLRDGSAPTTIVHAMYSDAAGRRRRETLEEASASTTLAPTDDSGRLNLENVLLRVRGLGCDELLVEPGPTLAASFIAGAMVERIWVFRCPLRVGDESTPAAAIVPADYVKSGEVDLAGDVLEEYLNPGSPFFFAPEPSADLVLARGQGM